MKRRIFAIIAAALLTAALLVVAGAEGLNTAIKRSEYEGNGVVEVDFIHDVRYNDPQLTVSDSAGNTVEAQIINTDDDDIKFRIADPLPGETYDYAFTGITARRSDEVINASGSIRIPAEGEVTIRKIEYDNDGEIEISFSGNANFSDVKAVITAALGGEFEVDIIEKDRDSIEGWVKGLEYGGIYTLTVSGVGVNGALSAEFIAVD